MAGPRSYFSVGEWLRPDGATWPADFLQWDYGWATVIHFSPRMSPVCSCSPRYRTLIITGCQRRDRKIFSLKFRRNSSCDVPASSRTLAAVLSPSLCMSIQQAHRRRVRGHRSRVPIVSPCARSSTSRAACSIVSLARVPLHALAP